MLPWWQVLLLVNAVSGGALFLHIWRATERHRNDNWQLEKKAISICRKDVKRWNFWKMLLGSMTMAWPRFLLYTLVHAVTLFLEM